MIADYPSPNPAWDNPVAEADMAYLLTVVNRSAVAGIFCYLQRN